MAGPIRISILANGAQARQQATLTGRAFQGMGRTIAGVGAAAGFTALTAKAVGFAKASVATEAAFSQAMNLIAANTDAPAEQIERLRGLAIKLGADTVFSANEAADAMLELAKGGFKPAQIEGGGVQATMALAATEGLELADAATIVSNAMSAFGLEAKNASQIADALAAGSAASSASVASLAEGLGNVGATARQSGLSLQDTTAALTILDANAIKGAEGGTALRSFLTALTPTSAKARTAINELGLEFQNADGSFRALGDISEQLRQKLGGLGEAQRAEALQTIFGAYAKQAASVFLSQGARGFEKYGKAVEQSGVAQKLADARMSGTAGALERMGGAIETAQLKLGTALAPAVIKGADAFGDRLVPAIEAGIDGAEKAGEIFGPAAKRISGSLERIVPSGEDVAGIVQDRVLPALETLADISADVADVVADTAVPLAQDLAPALSAGADAAQSILEFIDGIPGPVKEIGIQAGVAALVLPRLAAGFTMVQARATAAGASLLTFGQRIQQNRAAMTYATGAFGKAQAALHGFGGAARGAAGIGGLVALTQASQQTDDKMSALYSTMGGAALGFSIGGPIGALIGGAGGGLMGIVNATRKADDATEQIIDRYADLRSTLDEVTGATTSATRAYVYQQLVENKTIDSLITEGISRRTAVDAILGEKAAREEVAGALGRLEQKYANVNAKLAENETAQSAVSDEMRKAMANGIPLDEATLERSAALALEAGALQKQANSYKASIDGIREGYADLRKDTAAQRARADAVTDYAEKLDTMRAKVRKPIVAYLETAGVPRSAREVARLQTRLGLTPKRVTTVLEALGVDVNRRKVARLVADLEAAGKKNPKAKVDVETKGATANLSGWQRDLTRGLTQGKQRAEVSSRDIKRGIEAGPANARADLSTLLGGIRTGTSQARSIGASGGREAGSALGAGFFYGVDGWAASIAAKAASIVRNAVAAAKSEGRVKSPSRETYYIGDMLGRGLVDGIASREKDSKNSGASIVRALLEGVTNGSQGVSAALDKLGDYIDKTFDQQLAATEKRLKSRLKGKALDKALRDAERQNQRDRKAALKSLRQERAALIANGKAQDALQSGNYLAQLQKGSALWVQMTKLGVKNLDEARQKYKDLVAQSKAYSAQIKQGFVDYGSIVNLGEGTGFANSDQMLQQLRARAAQAQRYADMIRRLQAAGLNRTTIDQLLQAGVEGGFGTAQTILAGGQSAIAEINRLTAQIASTGGTLGDRLATTYYGAGIQAAEGLVKGLEQRQKQLDRVADRLASQMVKAVKKALGIKSPSRVFMGIGDQTVRGLEIGLDDTYVRRAGARLAGSLQQGFGSPQLAAYAETAAITAQSSATVDIRLSAAEVSRLQQGKELMATIDIARSNGQKWAAV